ncbi:hypothetical protein DDA93_02415 [Arthrobacter sp. Bz4]|nr:MULTISPECIES: hypothetical protein [unclassified Arthrobacter]PVE19624.1 hypothetical protein DDA93_02415 [Arthrobacter sp. Bz4]
MCRTTTCMRCRKTTWAGCGNHVDQVMRSVPKKDQCSCNPTVEPKRARSEGQAQPGWFGRLFGR